MKTLSHTPLPLAGILFLFCSLLIFFPSLLLAEESPEETATRLQKRYDEIHSLQFDFNQDTRGQLTGRPKNGRGQAFFVKDVNGKKAGMMRWNYSSPDQQVLVSDGKTFSMYFSTLKQMIVSDPETMKQDLTYSFFTGTGKLTKDFMIQAADKKYSSKTSSENQATIIKLTPKAKQSQVAEIHLWATQDSLIQRIEILDHFDTLTVLNFSNLKVNELSPDNESQMKQLFSFTPPEGTEIIQQ